MSTNDVPGHDPINNDALAMGCWAEHEDGSLIVVEGTEAGRVIFCVFDMSKKPVVHYRDAMPEAGFKEQFTWEGSRKKGKSKDRWTWHDKTPFPWSKVVETWEASGTDYASVGGQLTAAERVRDSLRLRGRALTEDDVEDIRATKIERLRRTTKDLLEKLGKAFDELR